MAVKRIDDWVITITGNIGAPAYPQTIKMCVNYKNASTLSDLPSSAGTTITIADGTVDFATIFTNLKNQIIATIIAADGGGHTTEDGSI